MRNDVTDQGRKLRECEWPTRYDSPPSNLSDDFYKPAFQRSVNYLRASGYFSSTLLTQVTESLDDFVLRGGTIKLLTSPNLSQEDLEAIGKGEEAKKILLEKSEKSITSRILNESIPSEILQDRLALLTWMIENSRLEIKLALREAENYYALFHTKIGMFEDESSDFITFVGSNNETLSGIATNEEGFTVHKSWSLEPEYAKGDRQRLEALWDGNIEGVPVWTINDWIKDPLKEKFGTREPDTNRRVKKLSDTSSKTNQDESGFSLLPAIPDGIRLRDYQLTAIDNWLAAKGVGVFAMATGTGKTFTALAASTKLSEKMAQIEKPLLVLVVVPSTDLVKQWEREALLFGFRPTVCYGSISSRERRKLESAFNNANLSSAKRTEMVITTAGSFAPAATRENKRHYIQTKIDQHRETILIIGDEMHSLGTEQRLEALPEKAGARLGLSATPQRHMDEDGTTELFSYFGEIVQEIDLEDAIYKYECLVPYYYYPEFIELTDEEQNTYRELSAAIAAALARGNEDAAKAAAGRRAQVLKHADRKLQSLRTLLTKGLANESHIFIYAAEGNDPDGNMDAKTFEIVLEMTREFGMKTEPYTAETKPEKRLQLQQRLASGEIQALVAMKCLDEGIDVPEARTGIFMASTQNPRQFIQRRGRLLRKAHGKFAANLYDMLVTPPADIDITHSEKKLIGVELARAAELARIGKNSSVIEELIRVGNKYNLDHEQNSWLTDFDRKK